MCVIVDVHCHSFLSPNSGCALPHLAVIKQWMCTATAWYHQTVDVHCHSLVSTNTHKGMNFETLTNKLLYFIESKVRILVVKLRYWFMSLIIQCSKGTD